MPGMSRPRHNLDLNKQVGRRIKNLRHERGLTLEQLAEVVDSQTGYLCDLETGRKSASLPMLADIARALGVEPFALLVDEERSPRHQLADLAGRAPEQDVRRVLTAAAPAKRDT